MNEQMDRAEWQRGEGMAMFRQLSDGVFQDIDQDISNGAIAEALKTARRETMHETYHRAYEVGFTVVQAARQRYFESDFQKDIEAHPVSAKRLDDMTFAQSPMQLYDEVVASVASLPLNILEMAQRKGRLVHPDKTVYQNLGSVAHIMTSEWFGSVIDQAAFTKNAYWGTLSISPLQDAETSDAPRLQVTNFDYDTTGDALTFDFDAATKQRLTGDLRATNHNFRSPKPVITAGEINGTTSGCPARFRHAVVKPDVAADLAERYGKPAEELIGPRPTNGIQDSLACLGRLLERAAIIDARL